MNEYWRTWGDVIKKNASLILTLFFIISEAFSFFSGILTIMFLSSTCSRENFGFILFRNRTFLPSFITGFMLPIICSCFYYFSAAGTKAFIPISKLKKRKSFFLCSSQRNANSFSFHPCFFFRGDHISLLVNHNLNYSYRRWSSIHN